MRAIDRLSGRGDIEDWEVPASALAQFLSLFTGVIVFTPGQSIPSSLQELGVEPLFQGTAELEQDLVKSFFDEIYVDRPERESMEMALPLQTAILVHGLPGCGKTILLKRLCMDVEQLHKCIAYLDLSVVADLQTAPEAVDAALRTHIRNTLLNRYINLSPDPEQLADWERYYIAMDPAFAQIQNRILTHHKKDLPKLEKGQELLDTEEGRAFWKKALESEFAEELLEETDAEPGPASLMQFLAQGQLVALCLDNVDAFRITAQEGILESAIRLQKESGLPVIVSIRDTNLARFTQEDAGADYVVFEKIGSLNDVRVRAMNVKNLPKDIVKELLDSRIQKVKDHADAAMLEDYFQTIKSQYGTFHSFRASFWELFDLMSNTFLDRSVSSYSNWSIRRILLTYFSFFSSVLLAPNHPCGLTTLLKIDSEDTRVTRMRTNFLRWATLGQATEPEALSTPNILDGYGEPATSMLCYRVLALLQNLSAQKKKRRISFTELYGLLARFGLGRDRVWEQLEVLARPQGRSDLGLVWIDEIGPSDRPDEDSRVELLPAGRFFLSDTSISREYIVWCALFADLKEAVVDGNFTLERTYSDGFKFDVYLRLMSSVLLPEAKRDLDWVMENLEPEAGYHGDRLAYYLDYCCVGGQIYLHRLHSSVEAIVDNSELSADRKAFYAGRLRELGRKIPVLA